MIHPRLIAAAVLMLSASLTADAQTSADVIVFGATPGGCCAAVAAAREGASVILLEPTTHIGGMNTGGLSFSDSNQMHRTKLMGLFHEWHLHIQQDYASRNVKLPYDVNVKDQAKWTYEPHVASRITNAMLTKAGVKVLTGRHLQSAIKSGSRVTRIETNDGSFSARVFIDCSYEGDLMAAAGVSWTIGRESKAEFGESYAGKQYPKKLMRFNGLDATGKPLPLVTATAAGPEANGDDNIMTYSFRLPLTKDSANKMQMPAPANYDPARFEVMRRFIQSGGQANMVNFDRYEIPGNKFDGNNGIGKQFSFGLLGGAKNWHTANRNERAAIFEAHKQYTLEFFHFLTNDSVFTSAQREEVKQFGLCKDEFAATGHWPPQLYVRESRRMKGIYTISQKDIIDKPTQPDPIMVASFPIDSHDCQRIAHPDGGVINEGTIFPVRLEGKAVGYPYQVPYRSILPKPAECDNLLVPVALSCTHVAMSSLRIEATWMLIGQSAGIAAAMAADRKIAVQDLPYADLKARLLAQKQELELPAEAKQPETSVTESKRFESKCLNLKIGDVKGFLIEPLVAATDGSKPWIWYAPTLGKYPGARMDWLFSRLLKQGFYICGTEVGDSFGSPQSRATYSKFYQHVVKEYGLSPKVSLLPQSRGGLMWYNWAVENPERVACIGGIYPVCDFTSYPGLSATAKTYGMTHEELTAKIKEHNPIERLAPLAEAKVPIFHLHGDKDNVVPLERNSGELIKRYQLLGGPGEVMVIPDKGHAEIAEFFESEELLEFLLKQGKPTTYPKR